MLSKCGAGWQFYADCFRHDCECGLLPAGAVQTLPNGFVADYDGSRVRVVAQHSDGDGGVYESEIATYEVSHGAD